MMVEGFGASGSIKLNCWIGTPSIRYLPLRDPKMNRQHMMKYYYKVSRVGFKIRGNELLGVNGDSTQTHDFHQRY